MGKLSSTNLLGMLKDRKKGRRDSSSKAGDNVIGVERMVPKQGDGTEKGREKRV